MPIRARWAARIAQFCRSALLRPAIVLSFCFAALPLLRSGASVAGHHEIVSGKTSTLRVWTFEAYDRSFTTLASAAIAGASPDRPHPPRSAIAIPGVGRRVTSSTLVGLRSPGAITSCDCPDTPRFPSTQAEPLRRANRPTAASSRVLQYHHGWGRFLSPFPPVAHAGVRLYHACGSSRLSVSRHSPGSILMTASQGITRSCPPRLPLFRFGPSRLSLVSLYHSLCR